MTSALPHRIVASLLVVVALMGCSGNDETTAPETPETAGTNDTAETPDPTEEGGSNTLDELISDFAGTADGGADVLIQLDGTLQRSAVGTGSDEGERLVPGRPFRVGSVSKPFIAVMVMQLVDESAVALEAQLSTYLPDTPVGADATIRQLLSHETGIPNYTDQPAFFPDVLADMSQQFEPTEMLAYVADVAPGPVDQFAYSNTNYILLGQLIEQIDGTDLNTSLQARITGPLALVDTIFDSGDAPMPAGLVGGWSSVGGDGDPVAAYASVASSAWAAGALISSTDDLAVFMEALAKGELVSLAALAEMTDFATDGYGFGLLQASLSPTQVGFGHNGSIPGYSSTMAFDPATGDFLVVLTNNDALNADQLAAQILSS